MLKDTLGELRGVDGALLALIDWGDRSLLSTDGKVLLRVSEKYLEDTIDVIHFGLIPAVFGSQFPLVNEINCSSIWSDTGYIWRGVITYLPGQSPFHLSRGMELRV